VLISGLTVIAAMAGMFLSGDKTFVSFAEGTILVVAIAIVASLTVLPAILSWLGDRVEKGRIPFLRRRPAGDSPFWSRVVNGAMRRPWLSIALAGGALLALAVPALGMKIVTSGPDDLPQNLALIKTYNRVKAAFPEEGVTADVVVQANDVHNGAHRRGDLGAAAARGRFGPVPPGDRSDLQQGRVRRSDLDSDGGQRQRRQVRDGARRGSQRPGPIHCRRGSGRHRQRDRRCRLLDRTSGISSRTDCR